MEPTNNALLSLGLDRLDLIAQNYASAYEPRYRKAVKRAFMEGVLDAVKLTMTGGSEYEDKKVDL